MSHIVEFPAPNGEERQALLAQLEQVRREIAELDLEEPESSQTQESSDLEEEPGVEEAPQSAPEETQEDAQATQTPQTGDEE